MRKINRIIIHCAATRPSMDIGAREIRDWHVNDNGWSDIGYHYVIRRNGQLEQGRPVRRGGAHVRGHNSDSIGICLVGGHGASANDSFDMHFTKAQHRTLIGLVARLQRRYGPNLTVHGHNEYANKGCPGFDVGTWWSANKPDTTRLSIMGEEYVERLNDLSDQVASIEATITELRSKIIDG